MIEFVRNNHKPNKIVSHPHTDSARQGCFLETVSAACAETLVSRIVHFSEQSHVGQNNNSDWLIPMQNIPSFSAYLSMCCSVLERGGQFCDQKGLSHLACQSEARRAKRLCAACAFKRIKYWYLAAWCSRRKYNFNRIINHLRDK